MISTQDTNVAVIGAGPYGLSLATQLRAQGVATRVFGTPMRTWLRMPPKLNLKSFGFATNIYVPEASFTFPEYCRKNGLEEFEPCSMASFAQYGLWVQKQLLPGVEEVDVTKVRADDDGFDMTLANGERFHARQVAVAVGLSHFARMPEVLRGLPRELASHTADNTGYERFKGKDVAVIGAGASALESATLLYEAGARPSLFVRGPSVIFHTKFNPERPLMERIKNPLSGLGPGRLSWMLENVPLAAHYLPEARRVRLVRTYLGPSGSWWLRDRFEGNVRVHTRATVVSAEEAGSRVRLRVDEAGRTRVLEVDHVLAGTGYEPDLDRLPFLDPTLLRRLARVERAPALSRHFESSVPGLYFVGLASAFSFGPLLRFVCGAAWATPTLVRALMRQGRGSARRSFDPVTVGTPARE